MRERAKEAGEKAEAEANMDPFNSIKRRINTILENPDFIEKYPEALASIKGYTAYIDQRHEQIMDDKAAEIRAEGNPRKRSNTLAFDLEGNTSNLPEEVRTELYRAFGLIDKDGTLSDLSLIPECRDIIEGLEQGFPRYQVFKHPDYREFFCQVPGVPDLSFNVMKPQQKNLSWNARIIMGASAINRVPAKT